MREAVCWKSKAFVDKVDRHIGSKIGEIGEIRVAVERAGVRSDGSRMQDSLTGLITNTLEGW